MNEAARDSRQRSRLQDSIGPGWFIGILILAAVIVGVLMFEQFSSAGPGREDSVARAAPSR